jgi:hypothetical protein
MRGYLVSRVTTMGKPELNALDIKVKRQGHAREKRRKTSAWERRLRDGRQ